MKRIYILSICAFALSACAGHQDIILEPSGKTWSSTDRDFTVTPTPPDVGRPPVIVVPPVVPPMPPVVEPPVVKPPSGCKRSHKGKCKNDNFKNGHYKDKKNKKPKKQPHTKHGSDRK